MNKILVTSLLAVTTLAVSGCNKGPGNVKLDDTKAKYSYAIGQQIGSNIKAQKIELNEDAFRAGILDAMGGKEPRLSEEESRTALRDLSQTQREARAKDQEGYGKKVADYLEANKKREGVKVTSSGLQYRVIKEGKGAKPKADDKVRVHYKGTLIDGKQFDSSYDRKEPAEFGLNQVIKGWTEGLQLMSVGSTYELVIPSELGYGPAQQRDIPANSALIFQVELLDILKSK